MSKKTDYKKLWRKAMANNKVLADEITRLNNLVKGYVQIIEQIKSGEIKVDKEMETFDKKSSLVNVR